MEKRLKSIIINGMVDQKVSYRQLAEKSGVHWMTIARWKIPDRGITVEAADKCLKALGLSVTLGVSDE